MCQSILHLEYSLYRASWWSRTCSRTRRDWASRGGPRTSTPASPHTRGRRWSATGPACPLLAQVQWRGLGHAWRKRNYRAIILYDFKMRTLLKVRTPSWYFLIFEPVRAFQSTGSAGSPRFSGVSQTVWFSYSQEFFGGKMLVLHLLLWKVRSLQRPVVYPWPF
jgi:hypothetical protein